MKRMVKFLKRVAVAMIGRRLANRFAYPYHNWRARVRTGQYLAALPPRDLLVNVGCGYHPIPGWVNIDLALGYADVVWDIRHPLPFKDQSCSAIFCEHVIEHLNQHDGKQLFNQFFRMLQPGGVVRISTPDAFRYLESYVSGEGFLYQPRFSDRAIPPIDRVNRMMRENGGHLWIYDQQSLIMALRSAGFTRTKIQSIGSSCHERMVGIDSPEREFESMYIEAIK